MAEPRPPRRAGATALGGPQPRRGRGLWWLLLAAVVLLVGLLLLLSRCGGDDDQGGSSAPASSSGGAARADSASASASVADSGSAAANESGSSTPSLSGVSSPSSISSSSGGPSASASSRATASGGASVGAQGAGTLTAGGTSLLPLAQAAPQGSLRDYDEMPVVGQGVTVLSVPADEGFWVGTSKTDRVWVQIIGSGESPYRVKAGDRVDLSGTMVFHGQKFAARVGVSADEGAAQLTTQMSHIKVVRSAVTLAAAS